MVQHDRITLKLGSAIFFLWKEFDTLVHKALRHIAALALLVKLALDALAAVLLAIVAIDSALEDTSTILLSPVSIEVLSCFVYAECCDLLAI